MAPQSPSALSDEFIPGKIMQNPLCHWAEFELICHHLLIRPFSHTRELSPWEQQLDGDGRLRDEVRLDHQSYREDSHYSTHYHLFLKVCPVQWQSCCLLIRSVYVPQALR